MDLPLPEPDPIWAETWQVLGQGGPTLAGLARLCSAALACRELPLPRLSTEAKAILFAARERAVIEIKGSNRAFDAPARMLAVYVETSPERTLIFRSKEEPTVTIRFLGGFRELCAAGLVMHHIHHDFSLTQAGLELAQTIPAEDVQAALALATEWGLYE